MCRRLLLAAILWLGAQLGMAATWNADWPLSDLSGIPASATYATYMEDLFRATDERAKATASSVSIEAQQQLIGGVWTPVDVLITNYNVAPITWTPMVPWYAGVSNNRSITYSALYTQVYTNGIRTTNNVVAYIPTTNGVITNVLYSQIVYTNGVWLTNIAYDITHTNVIPYTRWITTDLAYNLFKVDSYTFPFPESGFGDDIHWTVGQDSYTLDVVTTNIVRNPASSDPPVYGTVYSQVVSVVTSQIPYYLWGTNNWAVNWQTNYATVVATNYAFKGGTGIVARIPSYTTNRLASHWTITAGQSITLTNAFKLMTNNFGYAMPTLLANISDELIACAGTYGTTTNFDVAGQLDDFLDSAKIWAWSRDPNTLAYQWIYIPWRQKYTDGFYPHQQVSTPIPKWNTSDWLQYSGAGTNLYRVAIYVNPAQNKSGGNYVIVDPAELTVLGYQADPPLLVQFTVTTTVDKYVVTNDNPQFLCMSNQVMRVNLGTVELKPLYETTVIAKGFSPVFWYTTNTAYTVDERTATNLNRVDFVVTNLDWVANLTDVAFTRNTYSEPVGFLAPYDPKSAVRSVPYYTGGGAYIFPLISGYSGISYVCPVYPVPAGHVAATAEVWAASWVIVRDYTFGTNLVANWVTWFGTLPNALDQLHRLGYPTRVQGSTLAGADMGPSGYYYPGGTIRAETYGVGQMCTLDRAVKNQEIPDDYFYGGMDSAAQSAYPWDMSMMVWEKLITWPKAIIETSKATPATTTIPTTSLLVTGAVLYVTGPDDALYGYNGYTNSYETVSVTAPGRQASTLPLIGLTMNDSYRPRPSEEYASRINMRVFRNGYLPEVYFGRSNVSYASPLSVSTWSKDYVWNFKGASVTDNYFVCTIGRTTTNVVQTGDTSVTNIVVWPALKATNEVLTVPPGYCAVGTKISIVASNTLALYETHAGMINQAALDARYKAIKQLKYACVIPTMQTIYPYWTKTVHRHSTWYDSATPVVETATIVSSNYVWQNTAVDFKSHTVKAVPPASPPPVDTTVTVSIPAAGDDTLVCGPNSITNDMMPVWSVRDCTYPLQSGDPAGGVTYAPITLIGSGYADIGDSWGLNSDPERAKNTDSGWSIDVLPRTYTVHGMAGPAAVYTYYDYNHYTTHGPYLDGGLGSSVGQWPKKVQFVTVSDPSLATEVDTYANIGFDVVVWWQAMAVGDFEFKHTDALLGRDWTIGFVAPGYANFHGTNYTYAPITDMPTNQLQRYTTVVPTRAVYTSQVDYTTMSINDVLSAAPKVNIGAGSWSGNITYPADPDITATHSWDYKAWYYTPFQYRGIYFENVKRTTFNYP